MSNAPSPQLPLTAFRACFSELILKTNRKVVVIDILWILLIKCQILHITSRVLYIYKSS